MLARSIHDLERRSLEDTGLSHVPVPELPREAGLSPE
jgi:hypothetical protein